MNPAVVVDEDVRLLIAWIRIRAGSDGIECYLMLGCGEGQK